MGGTLYQGLVVHADGRFVADLEMGGGVARAAHGALGCGRGGVHRGCGADSAAAGAGAGAGVLPEAVFGQGYAATGY